MSTHVTHREAVAFVHGGSEAEPETTHVEIHPLWCPVGTKPAQGASPVTLTHGLGTDWGALPAPSLPGVHGVELGREEEPVQPASLAQRNPVTCLLIVPWTWMCGETCRACVTVMHGGGPSLVQAKPQVSVQSPAQTLLSKWPLRKTGSARDPESSASLRMTPPGHTQCPCLPACSGGQPPPPGKV